MLLVVALGLVGAAAWAYAASSRSAAAPLDRPATPAAPVVHGNRVLLVGDSLFWGASTHVTEALRADGWAPTLAAVPGTPVAAWSGGMAGRVAAADPDVVVVELGTNDCNPACPDLAAQIDELMRAVPTTVPVLWLNVQTQPTYPADPTRVNRTLDAARQRWRNMRLVDMNRHFRNHPEWHLPDGIHFDDAGSVQLANLVAGALRAVR